VRFSAPWMLDAAMQHRKSVTLLLAGDARGDPADIASSTGSRCTTPRRRADHGTWRATRSGAEHLR
jgi:hypothetical protein